MTDNTPLKEGETNKDNTQMPRVTAQMIRRALVRLEFDLQRRRQELKQEQESKQQS